MAAAAWSATTVSGRGLSAETLTAQADRPAGDQHHTIASLHGGGDRGSVALDHRSGGRDPAQAGWSPA